MCSKMNKIIVITIFVLCLFALFSCAENDIDDIVTSPTSFNDTGTIAETEITTDTESPYNQNPRFDKPNGDYTRMAEIAGYNLYEILDYAEAVILGEVVSDGEPYSEDLTLPGIGESFDVKASLTKTKIRVDEILYGESVVDAGSTETAGATGTTDKIIDLVQMGKPGVDDMVIKVRRGEKIILFAHYDDEKNYFAAVSFENGIFYIREDGLYTNSNLFEFAKYDGTPTELLKRDIAALIKEHNMTPETSYYNRIKK